MIQDLFNLGGGVNYLGCFSGFDFGWSSCDQIPAILYNRSQADSPLVLELESAQGNREAIGARVEVWTQDGKVQVFEIAAGGGYLPQSTQRLYVGLGGQSVDRISVRWPDGEVGEYPGPKTSD